VRFPDSVTVLRPEGPDEFGNPGSSFTSPTSTTTAGFAPDRSSLFLPAGTDVRLGDRVVIAGRTYAVREEPEALRSPSRTVLLLVPLTSLEV